MFFSFKDSENNNMHLNTLACYNESSNLYRIVQYYREFFIWSPKETTEHVKKTCYFENLLVKVSENNNMYLNTHVCYN